MSAEEKVSLLNYLDEPLVYKDKIVGYYSVGPDYMAFKFEKPVDRNNPAIKSFLLRETLMRTKSAYSAFDFELVFEGGKIAGIVCNMGMDRYFLAKFISRIAWSVAAAS